MPCGNNGSSRAHWLFFRSLRPTEAHGIPLPAITTGGNRNDVTQLIPLIRLSRRPR
jgi:hypothetical protein